VRLVRWLVAALVALAAIVFALRNGQPVQVDFWPLASPSDTRVFLIVLIPLALGFIVGEIVAWFGGRRWRREARQRAQRIETLERELKAAQARLEAKSPGPAPPSRQLSSVGTSAH
jgi:hypothetical protein